MNVRNNKNSIYAFILQIITIYYRSASRDLQAFKFKTKFYAMHTSISREFCKVFFNSMQQSQLGKQKVFVQTFDLRMRVVRCKMLLIGVAVFVGPKITRKQRMFFLSGLSVYAQRA